MSWMHLRKGIATRHHYNSNSQGFLLSSLVQLLDMKLSSRVDSDILSVSPFFLLAWELTLGIARVSLSASTTVWVPSTTRKAVRK